MDASLVFSTVEKTPRIYLAQALVALVVYLIARIVAQILGLAGEPTLTLILTTMLLGLLAYIIVWSWLASRFDKAAAFALGDDPPRDVKEVLQRLRENLGRVAWIGWLLLITYYFVLATVWWLVDYLNIPSRILYSLGTRINLDPVTELLAVLSATFAALLVASKNAWRELSKAEGADERAAYLVESLFHIVFEPSIGAAITWLTLPIIAIYEPLNLNEVVTLHVLPLPASISNKLKHVIDEGELKSSSKERYKLVPLGTCRHLPKTSIASFTEFCWYSVYLVKEDKIGRHERRVGYLAAAIIGSAGDTKEFDTCLKLLEKQNIPRRCLKLLLCVCDASTQQQPTLVVVLIGSHELRGLERAIIASIL